MNAKYVDKLRDEAIARIKCKMKVNAKLYEDGELTYEELHAVQNQRMQEIKDVEKLAEMVKNGEIKEFIDNY